MPIKSRFMHSCENMAALRSHQPSTKPAAGNCRRHENDLGLPLGGNVVMVLGFGFIAPNLAVKFIGQVIDRGVEIGV
jgi:hypothetical protein